MLHKCLFLSFFLNIILAAQVTKTDSTLNKNPKTAFYLSTVPGGGQLYNGKLLKGSSNFNTLPNLEALRNSLLKTYPLPSFEGSAPSAMEKQSILM